MHIRWSPGASSDFDAIIEHIAKDNESAAIRQGRLILAATRQLEFFPESGRHTRLRRTRELVVPATPYILQYSVDSESINLISIRHGAMLSDSK